MCLAGGGQQPIPEHLLPVFGLGSNSGCDVVLDIPRVLHEVNASVDYTFRVGMRMDFAGYETVDATAVFYGSDGVEYGRVVIQVAIYSACTCSRLCW